MDSLTEYQIRRTVVVNQPDRLKVLVKLSNIFFFSTFHACRKCFARGLHIKTFSTVARVYHCSSSVQIVPTRPDSALTVANWGGEGARVESKNTMKKHEERLPYQIEMLQGTSFPACSCDCQSWTMRVNKTARLAVHKQMLHRVPSHPLHG